MTKLKKSNILWLIGAGLTTAAVCVGIVGATPHSVQEVDAVCKYEDNVPTAMRCWDTQNGTEFMVTFQVKDGVRL